jgi:membrane associated rhomboid family serine protease
MPKCLKCGTELVVNEEGVAPVLCDRCAGKATSRASLSLKAGDILNFPATSLLLAINVGVFLAMPVFGVNPLSPSGEGLVRMGGNYGPLTIGGEYWRLLTAGFVHDGILHIGINMWCLWSLGRLAERLFGKWQTLCIYLITGVGGALLSIAYQNDRLSVGASGAVFGIVGALIAGLKFGDFPISWREQRATLSSVVLFAVISFVWGMHGNTDNMCHLGGFISGLLLGLPLGAFARRHKLLQLATILATAGVLFAAGRELVQTHQGERYIYQAKKAMLKGDLTTTIALLEKYTATNVNDEEAWLWLGGAYSYTGQNAKAVNAYQQALRINPDSEPARDALQTLHADGPTEK